ncbi:hypothetical protein KPH14_012956 [Odynerus spinipes]|uniref:Uncharacterized protein n=1 Tax=Odynerus spinipes TaxID=1348599 RepID=A0AAD9R7S1_9HYME|nr:hypothetical protein KPH14_012956 [Odynerus spinipes]
MVLQMSLFGKSIAYLERKQKSKYYKNGLLMFKIANEVLMSSVAKVDDIDQIAVIYTNSNKSDSASLQRIEFRPGKMIIQNFSNPDNIRAQHLDAKVISELKPISKAQVFKTDLNFMPFQEFPNKVMPNLNGTNNQTVYSSIPD